ncbi:hypothetical protein [Rosistilla ulvae]|nr:hypothetical protein [Rosistilla ulvae]
MSKASTANRLRCIATVAFMASFILAVAGLAGIAHAQPPEPSGDQPPPAADLLGDLDGLLDEAMQAEAETNDKPEPETDAPQAAAEPVDAMLQTLQAVDREMQQAIAGLGNGDAGPATQAAQRRALEMLQTIVDQSAENADQDQSQSSQRSEQQQMSQAGPQKPETDPNRESQQPQQSELGTQPGSEVGSSTDVIVNAGPLQGMREAVWGHLPERIRGELQATLPEKFLPRYRDAITEYFRQLSSGSDAKP